MDRAVEVGRVALLVIPPPGRQGTPNVQHEPIEAGYDIETTAPKLVGGAVDPDMHHRGPPQNVAILWAGPYVEGVTASR